MIGGGGKQYHSQKRRGGKATPPKGVKAAQSRRREGNNSGTKKNEVGKQQHPRKEEEWEATHSKEERTSSITQRRLRSTPLIWAGVAFLLFSFGWNCFLLLLWVWCCFPPLGGAASPHRRAMKVVAWISRKSLRACTILGNHRGHHNMARREEGNMRRDARVHLRKGANTRQHQSSACLKHSNFLKLTKTNCESTAVHMKLFSTIERSRHLGSTNLFSTADAK